MTRSSFSSDDIRETFQRFFERQGHTRVASSPLLPANDATLLFTNAGMVQFKDVFLGLEERSYRRATSSQRCVRAGGKHNDLDNVGRTARHHTFFEMLGNFSFGDYFKEDAIRYAWQLINEEFKLDPSRLWVTVFREDDDAARIWEREAGVRPDRIIRMGEKDNYWSMGDTGPQGPCSEILYDIHPELPGTPADAVTEADGDRFLEIWNLVFMQYNRDADGVVTNLPRPSIDTGAGLERITSILQGVPTNWDTDLLRPIIGRVEEVSGKAYSQDDAGFPFRVIADHARACTFLISDGILPSNEWRGYVLRRILRRAIRFGRRLGLDRPFFATIADSVIDRMASAYPEIRNRRDFVLRVIEGEEARFNATLSNGLTLLDNLIGDARAKGHTGISGEEAFRLYDTFGFPLELTQEVAEEQGLTVDQIGYDTALGKQRDQARASARFSGEAKERYGKLGLPPVRFVGYDRLEHTSRVVAIIADGETVDAAREGQEVELVFAETPAYAESGGQVGDTGTIHAETGDAELLDTQRPVPDLIVHRVRITNGYLAVDGDVAITIDGARRANIARNHTATHLLHAALHEVLGEHATQAGSLVAPNRLRFDFAHLSPVTADELRIIQEKVNARVLEDLPVHYTTQSYDEAITAGAMALFGEKYGDVVRTVCIRRPPVEELTSGTPCASLELCGGTHVSRTGEIGFFIVTTEGSVSAGIRRIEALTGPAAEQYITNRIGVVESLSRSLKAAPADVEGRVAALQADLVAERRRSETLERELAKRDIVILAERAETLDDVTVLVARVTVGKADALREMVDLLRERLSSAVIVLGTVLAEKPQFIAAVTPDLVTRGYHAGTIVKAAATVAGGGGGGRPELAQAGGRDATRVDEALAAARRSVRPS